jgi:ABC-type amino acid transport substrate-binding protein
MNHPHPDKNGMATPLHQAFLLLAALLIIAVVCCPVVAARDVRVALPELKPSVFTDNQGKPAGLFVDIIEDIAAREGWNIIWVRGTLPENWDRLSSGEIDLMPGVVDTPDREKLYDFNHEPVLSAWTQVYAPSGSGINTIRDLDGKRVAMLRGDNNGIAFRDYARKFDINATYLEKDSLDEVFAVTAAGDADAMVGFSLAGEQSANRYGLAATPVMFNPTSLGFAVRKGTDSDLLTAIDRYLAEGKASPSSAYSKTVQKWFGMKASWVVPPWLQWGLVIALGIAVLFVAMSFILRQQVRRKTAELARQNEELRGAYQQLTATEEELRQNYQELEKSEKALMQARKKLNLLNTLTFQDIRTGIFSLGGYIQLAKNAGCSDEAEGRLAKGEEILQSVRSSLDFARKYQNLGISQPRWQDVNYALINAISHRDFSNISRTVVLNNLEIYADPLFEDVFLTLMENIPAHGAGVTEVRIGYRQDADSVTILVADNGPGIPAAEKENIFTREYTGKTGSGLFLAREILSVTDISLRETGEPGTGARFEIHVPEGKFRFSGKTEN